MAPSFLGGAQIARYVTALAAAIGAATAAVYGAAYPLLGFHHVGPTALLAFVRPGAGAARVRWAGVGLGVGGLGNKGGVAVRMQLAAVEITAVGVHFAPHEAGADRRDRDWATLVRSLVFDDGAQLYPAADAAGHLFVFGDLNYRTADTRPAPVDAAVAWRRLLDADQLSRRRRAASTCHFLDEAAIAFPPTYKYVVTADAEDGFAKQRWPSWTDRILFLPSPTLSVETYDSIPAYRGSDHKPVFAVFTILPGDGAPTAVKAPWGIDEGWRRRNALARRGEYVVGAAMAAAESAGVWGVFVGFVLLASGTWWLLGRTGSEI